MVLIDMVVTCEGSTKTCPASKRRVVSDISLQQHQGRESKEVASFETCRGQRTLISVWLLSNATAELRYTRLQENDLVETHHRPTSKARTRVDNLHTFQMS